MFTYKSVTLYLVIPQATSCGGYNVFDPFVSQSVSQSVSPCFSCQPNSSETAQQNCLKFCSYTGHSVQMRISTGNFDSIFFSRSYAPFEHRNLTKIKDTTETVCQPNSSETAKENFLKLCGYEGHNVQMCISTGNFDSIFFLGITPFLNIEIWPK